MSKKGSANERELARKLSRWWLDDPLSNEDVFWRVMGSGSRATIRGQKGLTTYGTSGDIAAVHPSGIPFIEMFTVEAKKGYPRPKANPFESIDRIKPLTPASDNFDGWVLQAERASTNAKTPYWMIVFQRNRRRQMVCMPREVITQHYFRDPSCYEIKKARTASISGVIAEKFRRLDFYPLEELLAFMTPAIVRGANKNRKEWSEKHPCPSQ